MKSMMIGITIGTLLLGTTTAMFAEGEVAQRQERQQQRIANGVANGSMTAHETAKVEHQEAGLNKEVRTDRQANGGTLTPQERQQVNQQQNASEPRNLYGQAQRRAPAAVISYGFVGAVSDRVTRS